MGKRLYPSGTDVVEPGDVITDVQTDDYIELIRSVNSEERPLPITVASLFAGASQLIGTAKEIIAGGAVTIDPDTYTYVELNKTTPKIEAVIAAPVAGKFMVITQKDAGTAGHTVTLTAGTFDGTHTIATFDAQLETLVLVGISSTRYLIILNNGSVGLS